MVVQHVFLVVESAIYKPVAQKGEILATAPKYSHNKEPKDQAIQKTHATINRIAEIKG